MDEGVALKTGESSCPKHSIHLNSASHQELPPCRGKRDRLSDSAGGSLLHPAPACPLWEAECGEQLVQRVGERFEDGDRGPFPSSRNHVTATHEPLSCFPVKTGADPSSASPLGAGACGLGDESLVS